MKVLIMQGDSLNPPSFIRNLMTELLLQGVEIGLIGKRSATRYVPPTKTSFQYLHYPILNPIEQLAKFLFFLVIRPSYMVKAWRIVHSATSLKMYIKKTVLYASLLQYKPDVIHIQWATHLADFDDLIQADVFTFVVSLRGRHINVLPFTNPEVADLYRKLFPRVSGFHAVSDAIAREAVRYGAAPHKVKVIRSVINKSFLSAFDEQINPVREPLLILSVGRFHWKKGYADALRAMSLLKARGLRFKYTIVAGSEVPEEILFLVHQLDLMHEVTFIDKIKHDKVPELMKSNSVLLLPSLEEGVANVVLEAMAVGLPVVSTNAGGMAEVVVNGQTGWLVSVADANGMAQALEESMQVPEERLRSIRKNAFTLVSSSNQGDRQAEKFKVFYQDVMQRH